MKQLLPVLMCLFVSLAARAQTRTSLSGTVNDEQGSGIPGISLLVKGTNIGTSTDATGAFRLNITSRTAILVVSGVGYLRQEVPVGTATTLSITLKEDPKSLDEVVVTGFGIKQETRKLAYATQEVKGVDLERANSANLVNALQGKVAGVQIDQGSGGPMSS
ncbi:MAG: SusC/RagA family TonB-linked outer membrane protein, partial [Cytophagaceae bacterium]